MDTGSDTSIDLPGRRESVRRARQFVVDSLADVPDDTVDDLKLVVSELVTNAIEHGMAETVHVGVGRSNDSVRLTVRGGRGFIPNPAMQRMAPPEQLSGRGLQIVRSLTDDMAIGGTESEHEVVVTKRVS